MNNIPTSISILFAATTLLTVWLFYLASGKSRVLLIFLLAWMPLQAIVSLSGFYQSTGMPPRFLFVIAPGLLITLLLFVTPAGRKFLDGLDPARITLMHTIRIPVEITLYFVCIAGLIPDLMTFEGYNFDIISGITAPIMFVLVFVKKKLGKKALLAWNLLCLALLINVLTIAILSARTPFQQLAFEQPNVGVTYFPFIWLPSVVVPIVLISHLAAVRQLIHKRR